MACLEVRLLRIVVFGGGMSRPLLNFAGRALPVDEVMRLSRSPQVWANA